MSIAAKPFVTIVNHLLAREPWASERLAAYAGKRVRLRARPLELAVTIGHDGLLGLAAADALPLPDDVTLTVTPEALSALLSGGPAAVIKHVKIEGDAELAATLGKLAEQLRWDPEEDLSRLLGDAAAHRLAETARAGAAGATRAGRNLLESATEFWVDEARQLVRHAALDGLHADLATARDDLARLEKRIERLTAALQAPLADAAPGRAPRGVR